MPKDKAALIKGQTRPYQSNLDDSLPPACALECGMFPYLTRGAVVYAPLPLATRRDASGIQSTSPLDNGASMMIHKQLPESPKVD